MVITIENSSTDGDLGASCCYAGVFGGEPDSRFSNTALFFIADSKRKCNTQITEFALRKSMFHRASTEWLPILQPDQHR